MTRKIYLLRKRGRENRVAGGKISQAALLQKKESSSSSSIYFTNDLKHNCFYVDISIEIIVVTLGMYVIWGCIVLTAYALLSSQHIYIKWAKI